MINIAILDDYQKIADNFADWSKINSFLADSNKSCNINFFSYPTGEMPLRQLATQLHHFQVIAVMRERTPLPENLLQQLPNLKLIVTTGMRNSSIDFNAAKKKGITVCGTESPPYSTSELTMALLLALARNVTGQHASVVAGGWQLMPGRTLHGAKLGLLGLGKQGEKVAKLALAFGMEVSAHSTNLTQARCKEVNVKLATKEQLFRNSNFISVHLKESARSKGMVNEEYLKMMPADSYFVNTSRSSIVDYKALCKLLNNGSIAGAALDVFDIEPLPVDSNLRKTRNLLLSPHMGYVCNENYRVFYSQTVECILAFLKNAPIRVLTT